MKTYVDAGKYIDLVPYLDADEDWKASFTDGIFSLCTFDEKIYGSHQLCCLLRFLQH
jgi:ABC-type glycerol-3-phosphate transport system substrate-binding protein